MEIKAKLSNLRMSPRKVQLVGNIIRGMDTVKAKEQLKFINKKASLPLAKLLDSAVANATNDFKLDKDNLYIKSIIINEGRKIKRYKPRAMGRATIVQKRASTIDLVLAEKVESKKIEKQKKKTEELEDKKADLKVVTRDEIKSESKFKGKEADQDLTKEEEARRDKPATKFQKIKDKFTRRTGER